MTREMGVNPHLRSSRPPGASRSRSCVQRSAAIDTAARRPRAYDRPLDGSTAWELVTAWLDAPVAWIPQPGPKHPRLLGELISTYDVRGNLVPDAMLAALAIEHGLTLYSADTDFARFRELRWENPLS